MSFERLSTGSGPSIPRSRRTNYAGITRRQFVQGIVAGGVIASLDLRRWLAFAAKSVAAPPILSGNSFNLVVEQVPVNYTGRSAYATAVNGSVPAPTLQWREGDAVTLSVTNWLKETTSIHWHGIRSPSDIGGVPGLSFQASRRARPSFTFSGPAKRDVLVSQPQPFPGTDGKVRGDFIPPAFRSTRGAHQWARQ